MADRVVKVVKMYKVASPGSEYDVLIVKSDLGIIQLTKVSTLSASEDWPISHLT